MSHFYAGSMYNVVIDWSFLLQDYGVVLLPIGRPHAMTDRRTDRQARPLMWPVILPIRKTT